MKYIGDIKSVYMMWSEFEFRSGKLCHEWHYLSSLITGWICWKCHNIGGPSDLSKGVCQHKLWSKKIYTERVCFTTDILHPHHKNLTHPIIKTKKGH